MKRLVSGIKPTGELTIGNYIGAIKHFKEMQKEYETFVFVADLHAITINNDPEELKRKTKDIIAIYLACGLDPEYTTLFIQSEKPNNFKYVALIQSEAPASRRCRFATIAQFRSAPLRSAASRCRRLHFSVK